MWPLLGMALRRYAIALTLPIAGVVGLIGYHIEGWISDRYTPVAAPITQQRQERLLENLDSATSKKHNPLEVNLSPSLTS
ncbi:small integral membrane protein 12 isoform X2 [Athalia rosae]|uniref:small integral membrane protein 12 isoform X2 n=1 Tax=Athalia rosae TaxID=37344 RepID=UPI0006269AFF|nr:small integral membrane protein 12 isoform X2 [Athalia rosae]